MLLSVTPREFATILAALRFWQEQDAPPARQYDIATDCGEIESLGNDEIDTLCEQLNAQA
jgi:hypothetical protein